MNRFNVIKQVADAVKCKTYMEIGVKSGEIFFQVKCPLKIAVDPCFNFSAWQRFKRRFILRLLTGNRELFFEKTSDDFFANHSKELSGGIDLAFIDGLHTHAQVMRDVQNTMKYLNPHGVIILHDCSPLNEAGAWPVKNLIGEVLELAAKGKINGWNGTWNGDVWKAVVQLRSELKDYNLFTLDLDWGLGILTRGKMEKNLSFNPAEIERMTYSDLEKQRELFLNLKHPAYLGEFLKQLTVQ
ncbi:MAG TPA: class I SAM-dependent methyltransferase [Bacteroidia bacterium]|nr:class I SAM-dependent methyltransferase [Bacteroidia bacterium]